MARSSHWNSQAYRNRNRLAIYAAYASRDAALNLPRGSFFVNHLDRWLKSEIRYDVNEEGWWIRRGDISGHDLLFRDGLMSAAEDLSWFWNLEIDRLSDEECLALVQYLNNDIAELIERHEGHFPTKGRMQ